jgi:hypothetical protein
MVRIFFHIIFGKILASIIVIGMVLVFDSGTSACNQAVVSFFWKIDKIDSALSIFYYIGRIKISAKISN